MKTRAASHLFKNLFRKPRNAIYIQQISQNWMILNQKEAHRKAEIANTKRCLY